MGAILYSFRRCPYAMRARMALHVSGLEYEHREVLLRDKPDAMLQASPKGTVPVFVMADGTVIDESYDVMAWALSQNDPLNWMDCDPENAELFIDRNDGPFKHHLDHYKYASRYDKGAQRGDVDLTHRRAAEKYIHNIEQALEAHKFIMGAMQSVADIAIFPFIRQFANTDKDWWEVSPYPRTRNWLTRHTESDLFKTIMTKHPVWTPS